MGANCKGGAKWQEVLNWKPKRIGIDYNNKKVPVAYNGYNS